MVTGESSVNENKSNTVSSLFSTFSSTWASTSSKVMPDLNKRLNTLSESIQQRARDLPKNISMLPDQLNQEREQFMKSKLTEGKQQPSPGTELSLPWEGYSGYEDELKRRILAITKDERNLIVPPPTETTFEFDLKAYGNSARALLEHDKTLSELRFILVPQKLTEEVFWRNYFYRVTIVKQQVLSDVPASDKLVDTKEDVLFDYTDDEKDGEMDKSDDALATVTSESEAVLVSADDDMEDWERELRREAIGSS
ncbi:hypothetical protein BC940DRAFT_301018 [Gongronella butleri]|nr:hypothetical protein BC940DRAFT_301018 [Gongronella butleri]